MCWLAAAAESVGKPACGAISGLRGGLCRCWWPSVMLLLAGSVRCGLPPLGCLASSAVPQLCLGCASAGALLVLCCASAGPPLVLGCASAGSPLVLGCASAGPLLVVCWSSAGLASATAVLAAPAVDFGACRIQPAHAAHPDHADHPAHPVNAAHAGNAAHPVNACRSRQHPASHRSSSWCPASRCDWRRAVSSGAAAAETLPATHAMLWSLGAAWELAGGGARGGARGCARYPSCGSGQAAPCSLGPAAHRGLHHPTRHPPTLACHHRHRGCGAPHPLSIASIRSSGFRSAGFRSAGFRAAPRWRSPPPNLSPPTLPHRSRIHRLGHHRHAPRGCHRPASHPPRSCLHRRLPQIGRRRQP